MLGSSVDIEEMGRLVESGSGGREQRIEECCSQQGVVAVIGGLPSSRVAMSSFEATSPLAILKTSHQVIPCVTPQRVYVK